MTLKGLMVYDSLSFSDHLHCCSSCFFFSAISSHCLSNAVQHLLTIHSKGITWFILYKDADEEIYCVDSIDPAYSCRTRSFLMHRYPLPVLSNTLDSSASVAMEELEVVVERVTLLEFVREILIEPYLATKTCKVCYAQPQLWTTLDGVGKRLLSLRERGGGEWSSFYGFC